MDNETIITPSHNDDSKPHKSDKTKKKITALTVALVIFVIATLGLGGYTAYSLITAQTEPKQNTQTTTEAAPEPDKMENVAEANQEELAAPKSKVVSFYPDSVAILNDEHVYVSVGADSSMMQTLDRVFGDGTSQTLQNTQSTYQEFEFSNLTYTESNQPFKGMELNISGVSDLFVFDAGQQISPNYGLLMLYEDGDVSTISLPSLIQGNNMPTIVSGLSDIVNIYSEEIPANPVGGGIATYAVNSAGEVFNLSDYISSY